MKRLIAAAVILLIIIGTYIGSSTYTDKICKTAIQGIESCSEEYKEHGTAKADAAWLKNYWNEKEKILSIFVNHNLIDEIEVTVSSIELYSAFENNYMFYDACNRAKVLLHQILEDTKPTTHSVF